MGGPRTRRRGRRLDLDAEGLIGASEPPETLAVERVMATLDQGMPFTNVPTSLQDRRRQITEGDPDPYSLDAETILTVPLLRRPGPGLQHALVDRPGDDLGR